MLDDKVFKGANYIITISEKIKKKILEIIEDLAYEMGFKRVKRITPRVS